MIVNQANLHGLTVGYSTAFNKSFDTTQSNYQKVATVVPSTTGEQDYKWLGQMPGMREWIGEREVQALAAYDYLIKNKKFEMTIGVPRDDIEDDKYGVYTPLFSNMGEAAALQPDELVFGAMMSGFNEKCYDGLSFFNTAHKVGDATYSNRSNKKLSRESYMEGRSSIMSIKGDKGKSLKLVPDLLVVPPALEETARLILEADQIDGTTNVLKGTAKLHVEPALAEHPEYWFLLCTNRFLKPFIYQLRKKIKFTSLTRDTDENVFMLDEYLYGADGRSNAGYGFWQMLGKKRRYCRMATKSVITKIRRKKMAEASHTTGTVAKITHIALGSGGVNADGTVIVPLAENVALKKEVVRKPYTSSTKTSDTSYEYTIKLEEDELVGTFISEMALIDEDGDVVAFSNFLAKGKDETEVTFTIEDNY